MKVLPFNHDNKELLNVLYHALLTGRGFRTPEARVVNRIKKAFEAEAKVVKEELPGGGQSIRFKIECKPGESKVIKLEDAEFELLNSVFMGIDNWHGPSTEDVERAEDYLKKEVKSLEDWEALSIGVLKRA